jgi:alcohol dehydrogenase class IV
MTRIWTFHTAGKLIFGPGAVAHLESLAASSGWRTALVVTDPALVAAGALEAISVPLRAAGVRLEVFTDGVPEPPLELADSLGARVRSVAADVIVALGGGSNIDLAKIAAVVARYGGAARDYAGDDKVPGPIHPLVAIPTTAGTGSEVTQAAVLTHAAAQIKLATLSNHLRPAVALVDPVLTLSCPKQVTADSGMDALTHALEAYTAVDLALFQLPPGERTTYQGRNPLTNLYAAEAIRLVGRRLAQCVEQPIDLEARTDMALAATLAGWAFSNSGVAMVHALEYPVGGLVHCSHGLGNALLLVHCLRYNRPAREPELARVAELLGLDVAGLTQSAAADRTIEAVDALRARVGIPARLRDLGVRESDLPTLAAKAAAIKRVLRVNPRPVTEADALAVYQAAW